MLIERSFRAAHNGQILQKRAVMRNMALRTSEPAWREIALAMRVGVPHIGRVAQGIRDYAAEETDWRFLISPETHDLPPESLKGWHGAGVIAQCNTEEEERVLARIGCPVVNLSGVLRKTRFPRVRNDYRGMGARGGMLLLDRGFRRFGFYGVEDVWYSEEIEAGYRDAIERCGFRVETLRSQSSIKGALRWDHGQEELDGWIRSMQPPFAVMAAHDPRATMVIRACERVGLRVPADVAVVGVNDDAVTCETIRPSLTSIRRNGHEVGRKAAQTLERMISGRDVSDEIIIPDGGVSERDSTQTLVIHHPALAAAVEFVDAHFHLNVGVTQMVESSGRSRRWLEDTFRRELRCSPAEFLKRCRVKAVVQRLSRRERSTLGVLAAQCGFSGTRQLNAAFEGETGLSVKQFVELRSAGERGV
jgi:LacI family transcriptional regulator